MLLAQPLLSPDELRIIERSRLVPRRAFAGRTVGERLSRQKGHSIEFADYREYADGDDLRHLDWAILGRLDRATIRTYQDEDDLAVYIALDTSRSMDFGEPAKFAHAQRVAAAFTLCALAGQDTAVLWDMGSGVPQGTPARGRASYARLSHWIASREPTATGGLARSLSRFANSARVRPGLVVCISDGLDPDIVTAIGRVAGRGHEIAFIQVLSAVELDPDIEGDLRLLDSETGQAIELTAHGQALATYKRNLAAHCEAIETAVRRSGGRHARTLAGDSVRELFGRELRRMGLVS